MMNLAIGIQIVTAFLLPVLAFMLLRKKSGGFSWRSAFVGAAVFVVFSQVLEKLLHVYVFTMNPTTMKWMDNAWIYALYGGLAAGLFEELGRYAGFKLLLRRNRTRLDGLSFGTGHGGVGLREYIEPFWKRMDLGPFSFLLCSDFFSARD